MSSEIKVPKAIDLNPDTTNPIENFDITEGYNPEIDNEVSQLTAGIAGIASGVLKIPEGLVSLGAELIDLGLDTNYAVGVEQFFDKINPFEEVAAQKAAGRITEALTQVVSVGTAGAKIATTLANKAVKAKRAGKYVDLKSPNINKGITKATKENLLSGKQKFAAVVVGGSAGETLVADVENIGTFGDVFEGGPTELDRDVTSGREDAQRKILNRLKFGSESLVATPFIYGTFKAGKLLATRGKELAFSDKKIERNLNKFGGFFRPRDNVPEEIFLARVREKGKEMADTNFAMEQVKRIDREVDKMFPGVKSLLDKSNDKNRNEFLKDINELLFSGDLKSTIPDQSLDKFIKRAQKFNASEKSVNTILTGVNKVRNRFDELLDTATSGPANVTSIKKLQTNLRELMGDRVKQYIGTTYRAFQNQNFGFYTRYKPTDETVNRAKTLFMRYAAKNKNPITEQQAENMVTEILEQAKQYNPKTKLPTFTYENLTAGADSPENVKTFARTLKRDLPEGGEELKVIGKGSKIFRELFGEIDDARYSIYEGIGRLSAVARKNQLFDEILDVDEALKAARTPETPPGQRGFFFSSKLEAQKNFGGVPRSDIVKIDDYVQNYFKDGVLINRLQGYYTTKDIAEAFSNSAKVSEFMRGESGGQLGRTASWLWRNLFLTPKAGSQFAKTVLSVPTHIRNFLSSSAFSLANGTIFVDPRVYARAMKEAAKVVQVGLRKPEAMEKYREYLKLGIVNTNVRMGDLKNLMRDAKINETGNVATDSILKPMLEKFGKIGEGLGKTTKATAQKFQDIYVAEDDFWKIINYETELQKRINAYEKSGMKIGPNTMEEIKRETAEIVKNTIPNYAYVGSFVRAMRVTPFGNFMSWPSEIFRTGYGIIRQGIKDIKDPVTGSVNYFKSTSPTKSIGLQRLIGATIAFGVLPYSIVKGVQSMQGVSDEEAESGKDFVAPWSKDSQILWFKDPETGELYYSDWSSNNVYDTLTRPAQTVLNAVQQGVEEEEVLLKGLAKGIVKAAAETADPFIGESIFTEAVADIIARGGRTRDGRVLYTEQTPEGEKYGRIFRHIAQTQLPQYKQFLRVYDSATGKPDRNGDVISVPKQLAGVFGFRLIKLNPDKAMNFYLADYRAEERNSKKEFTGGPEGTLKPATTSREVIERYFVANKALFEVHKKMRRHIKNAKNVGLDEDKLAEIFNKRGLKKDYSYLNENIFSPYFPSRNIIQKFDEIATDTNRPNPFTQAEQTIEKMYEDFSTKSLNDTTFNFKLEDYLPKPQPSMSQAPLPEQPQPSPQVVNAQPNVMQSGLTPTEQALLSEEEKSIKLKQRGLM
tara:strand:+ start:3021 stop:7016 length:3996 start_codon:yes stop_codon:yes gene_type:complete